MSAFVLISDATLTSAAATISAPVDTAYRMFRVTMFVVKDGTPGTPLVQLNSDSGTNYARQILTADSTTVSAARQTGQTSISTSGLAASTAAVYQLEVSKPLAGIPARATLTMASLDSSILYRAVSGEWSNTADLISSIDLSLSAGNFAAGTRILVEGAAP